MEEKSAREEVKNMPNREQQPGSPITPVEGSSPLAQNQSTENAKRDTQKGREKGVPVWEKLFRIGGAAVATATSIFAQLPREVSAQDIHQALEASKLIAQTQIQQEGMPSQRAIRQTATGLEVQQEAIKSASQGDALQIQESKPQEIEVIVEVTNFENLDMQVTGDGRAGALIKRPFGNGTQVNVALGELDVSGTTPKLRLDVKNFPVTIEDPRSIGISETDPNTVVVVGKHSFIVTTDGFQNKAEIAVPDGWFAKGVIISPDNAYAYIPLLGNDKGPGMLIYKFATGDKIAQEVQFDGTQPSDSQYLLWPTKPYYILPNQPLYRAYASLWNNHGYVELTLDPIGVQGKILNTQQNYPRGRITQAFDSQGRNVVFNVAVGPQVYENRDGVQTNTIVPREDLYPAGNQMGDRILSVSNIALGITTRKFYLATTAAVYDDQGNLHSYRFIEEGSSDAPTDMNQRRLMPTNGDWPSNAHRVSIVKKDSMEYFIVTFGPQGIRTLRVPNGEPADTNGGWVPVSAQVTEHRLYVPVVTQNATSSW